MTWGQCAAVRALPAQQARQAVANGHAVTPQRDAYSLSGALLEALASSQARGHECALRDTQEQQWQPHGLGQQFQPHDRHVLPQQQKQEGHADVAAREMQAAEAAEGRGAGATLSRCSSVGSCSYRPCAEEREGDEEEEGEECGSWETDSFSSWEFDDVDGEEEEVEGDERREGEEREEGGGEDGLGRQPMDNAAVRVVNETVEEDRQIGEEGRPYGSPRCNGDNDDRVDLDRPFEDAAIAEERRQEGREWCAAGGQYAPNLTSLLRKRKAVREGDDGRTHVGVNHTHHAMAANAVETQCRGRAAEQGGVKRQRV